jgi:hypothetical protein
LGVLLESLKSDMPARSSVRGRRLGRVIFFIGQSTPFDHLTSPMPCSTTIHIRDTYYVHVHNPYLPMTSNPETNPSILLCLPSTIEHMYED